jgi:nucleoside 2-deoxyribosyltransferase
MTNCYIAAALFTPAQIRVNGQIAAIVREVGLSPLLPSEMSAPVWQGRAPKDCTSEERRQVLDLNIQGLHDSQYVIARVSGDTKQVDTGVAFEMGYYRAVIDFENWTYGDHKDRRYLIAYIEPSDKAQSLNLMLAESVDAAVYGQAQLHQLLTMLLVTEKRQPCEGKDQSIATLLAKFAPDKIVMHEREPVGLENDPFGDPLDDQGGI